MSTTSKSPRKVALVPLEVGNEALPAYRHRFSPKVFTQPQLFACLALKEFFKADYRGIMGILANAPSLCDAIGLRKVPQWTTLQKASRPILRNAAVQGLLDATAAPTGYYRGLMHRRLHLTRYGQRWQVETAVSTCLPAGKVIKRRLGPAVNARSYWSECRALILKAVAHNILIL